jgi:hypothetical protein
MGSPGKGDNREKGRQLYIDLEGDYKAGHLEV